MDSRYSIGEISKMFNISTFTVRFYEKKGLVRPNVDKTNMYRYYNAKHIKKIKAIIFLKTAGFSIEEIGNILRETDRKRLQPILHNKLHEINEKIDELKRWKNSLTNMEERMGTALEMNGQLKVTCIEEEFIVAIFEKELHLLNSKLLSMDISKHMLYIDKESLFTNNFITKAKFAVEVTKENLIYCYKNKIEYENHVVEKDDKKQYLLTHLVTDYHNEPIETIEKIKVWLHENNRQAGDDIILRFIGVQGYEEVADLYEVWIPLKNI